MGAERVDRTSPSGRPVRLTRWGSAAAPPSVTLIVPGWGMHALPYEPLAEQLVLRGAVAYGLDLPGNGRARLDPARSLDAQLEALHSSVAEVHREFPQADLTIAAESAGAMYLVAASPVKGVTRSALLAPGVLPRARQLIGAHALRDAFSLVLANRLPLLGWRVEAVSSNASFVEERRDDDLTLASVDRRYVITVARAVVRALTRGAPTVVGDVKIWQGSADRLLSPSGSRLLLRRLPRGRAAMRIVPGGDHGLIWDPEHGTDTAREIAAWLVDSVEPSGRRPSGS